MTCHSPFESDRQRERDHEDGSKRLLAALWREHPNIMRALGAVRR